jgi:hypothetical protein
MADPREYVVGSSSLVLGVDSYTSPAELDDKEMIFGQNVVVRGGIAQTRPGSRSLLCAPDGNFQGCTLFTPANGVAHLVFMVDGKVYVSAAPFTSYRRLWSLQFSLTAPQAAWAVCLKSTDYDNEGNLIYLDNPYSVLVIQDGLTRAAYWDGSTAAHINPAPAPDNTDTAVTGYQGTPVGLWMIWSGNRLWVSRGNQVFASDIGNPLKFTESQYLNEGRAFYLSGPCTGMVEVPSGNGEDKGFIAFTENDGTLFQSYIQDRTQWLSTPLFQNTILPNIGCVAPRSLVTQYGLNWWFSARGLTNLNAAFRQNLSSRIDYQDNQMMSSKAYLSPVLGGVCGVFYENYLMMSVPSGDVLNRHTWVLDQAPFDGNVNAWTGIWTGWRPIEWCRGIINGDERVFFGSIDYDGKNRIWEGMLEERKDNGCPITCYVQLRDHAGGNLDLKKYSWSKFYLSQILGEVYLNVYVASTKGGYQLQKNYKIVANEGQIYSDTEYSEAGPLMVGNRVQSRTIRTPADPEDDECNVCGVESKEGNKIDYAFSNLLVWSGIMGVRAYQIYMREWPERFDGDCEEPEEGPRSLNAQGCSALSLFADGEVFPTYEAVAEGTTYMRNGALAYIQRTAISAVSQADAQRRADCAVAQYQAALQAVDVSDAGCVKQEVGTIDGDGDLLIVDEALTPDPIPEVEVSFESESGTATLIGISEYTSPSSPPKKYLTETLTGELTQCAFTNGNGCTVVNGFQGQTRNVVGGTKQYDPTTGVLTDTEYWDFWSANPDGTATCTNAIFRNSNAGVNWASWGSPSSTVRTNRIIGQTTDSYVGTNVCTVEGSISYKRYNTATRTLSNEDTEANAIARAIKIPGTASTASTQNRGAGDFSFLFVTVTPTFLCSSMVPGETYRVSYEIMEEDYGGGNQSTSVHTFNFTASAESQSITIPTIQAPSGKQQTVQNASIQIL